MLTKAQWFASVVVCVAALWIASADTAFAQANYPNRAIRVIVPFSPGGGSDVTARFVGTRLSDRH